MPDLVEDLNAALGKRYEIDRELGRGGMATVYLANDLKHDRPVALKILRPGLAAVLGPERFLREIRLTAKLAHPHILPVLDSGKANGFLYYVMPYVDGESLRDRLAKDKQLSVEHTLNIAREVSDALQYAHDQGIVHRDIKPENILFEAGHAIVADFGIAKAVTSAGGSQLTETGMAVGTPAYMSPEQASGSGEVDGRSDVYALGCVVYEMLGGRPPFVGPTPENVIRQHVVADPPDLSGLRSNIPTGVRTSVERALAKLPSDRFDSPNTFAAALAVPGTDSINLPSRFIRFRWAAVVTIAVLVAIGIFAIGVVTKGPNTLADASLPVVVIVPFENRTGMSTLDEVGEMAASWITDGASRLRFVDVVPSMHVHRIIAGLDSVAPSERNVLAGPLVDKTGADVVVSGSYFRRDQELEFQFEIVDVEEGTLPAPEAVRGEGVENPAAVVEGASRAVIAALAYYSDDRGRPAQLEWRPPRWEAYEAFDAAGEALLRGDMAEAERLAWRAIAWDSSFVEAYLLGGSALNNQGRRFETAELADALQRSAYPTTDLGRVAYRVLRAYLSGSAEQIFVATRDLAQHLPYMRFNVGFWGVLANHPREASHTLMQLDPARGWLRDWRPYWNFLQAALHLSGDYTEELRIAEREEEFFPVGPRWAEMRARSTMGLSDELWEEVQRALSLARLQYSWLPTNLPITVGQTRYNVFYLASNGGTRKTRMSRCQAVRTGNMFTQNSLCGGVVLKMREPSLFRLQNSSPRSCCGRDTSA